MDKKIPGIPAVGSVKDDEARKVLQALIDGWRLRNGHTNDSGAQFVTRDELEKFIGAGEWDGGGFRNGIGRNGPTAKSNLGGIGGLFRDHVAKIIEEIKNSLLWKSLSSRIDRLDGPGGVLDRIGLAETGIKRYVSQTDKKIEVIDAQLVLADGNLSTAVNVVNTEVAEGYARTFNSTTLQAMVNDGNLIAQEALDIINAPGSTTSATWQVKFDVNGYVVGAGLGLEGKNGVYTSQFLVKADRFAVGTPGETPVFPFIADANGVYINGNLYVNAGGPALEDLALDVGIAISASDATWRVDSDGVAINPAIYLVANLRSGLSGFVTWSKTSDGTTPPAPGTTNSWTIFAADQSGLSTGYIATLVSGGKTYTKRIDIYRVKDGVQGAAGVSGTIGSLTGYGNAYAIVSSVWSDAIANRVIYNMLSDEALTTGLADNTHLAMGDTVTLSSATFADTRYWSGTSWLQPGVVINGNLLVNGTVSATKITAGSISTSGGNASITIGATSFLGDITTPFHVTKSSAIADQALITASNNKDVSVCIWGASTYAAGNAVSGTWHRSDAERNAGRWDTIGILGSNANSTAVAGNVYGDNLTQSGGYFRFHTTASDSSAPVVTNYAILANKTSSIIANGKFQLFGAGSSIMLGTSEGTAGQVLTSAGPNLTPTWTTVSSGGITYAALQGVTSGTTGSALDLTATMRVTGLTIPSSGEGLEFAYSGALGWIQSYDRTASAYRSLNINASSVVFNCVVTGTSFNGITGLAGTGSATTAAKSDHTHSYGTVTSFSFTNGNGITGTVGTSTTTPSLSFTLGAVTGTSFNGVTGLSSTTPAALGTAAVGTATTAARADHVHAASTTYTAVQGALGGTTGSALSLTTTFRATGINVPASGAGLELAYSAGSAFISAYDRTGVAYRPMVIDASLIELKYQGTVKLTVGSTVTATTPATSDSSTTVATTAYVKAQGYTANPGTVTSFSFTTGNGITGSVSAATTTPALSLTLGALTGTSFNSITGLSSTTPAALGSAAVGTATTAARADHVHPGQKCFGGIGTTVAGGGCTVTIPSGFSSTSSFGITAISQSGYIIGITAVSSTTSVTFNVYTNAGAAAGAGIGVRWTAVGT